MTVYQQKQDDPNYVFVYDETVESCLRWKNSKRQSNCGKAAGTLKKTGGWAVVFRGKQELVSRVIYEMFNGPFEDRRDTVHFKNNDYSDTRIGNLYVKEYKNKNWQNEFIEKRLFKNIFDYRDGELYWTDDRWFGYGLQAKAISAGDMLSYKFDKDGYKSCSLYRRDLRLHRVIYEWHFGPMDDDLYIDHINGVPHDNRIENLRAIKFEVNARNRKNMITNSTGVIGVSKKVDSKTGSLYYTATWRCNSKCKQKAFAFNKYGEQQAFKLACEYRDKMIAKLNQELGDEGYHENHGKR